MGTAFRWYRRCLAMISTGARKGMAILARIKPFLHGIDRVIVPETLVDYQRDALILAGLPHDK